MAGLSSKTSSVKVVQPAHDIPIIITSFTSGIKVYMLCYPLYEVVGLISSPTAPVSVKGLMIPELELVVGVDIVTLVFIAKRLIIVEAILFGIITLLLQLEPSKIPMQLITKAMQTQPPKASVQKAGL